jgi:hypothetical protein
MTSDRLSHLPPWSFPFAPPPPERLRRDAWAAGVAVRFERDGGVPAMAWPWFREWRRNQVAAMRRWTRRRR